MVQAIAANDAAWLGESRPEDTFAWVWQPWVEDPDAHRSDLALLASVRGRPLVDLGCGRAALAWRLAERLGASAYVGVDLQLVPGPRDPLRDLAAATTPAVQASTPRAAIQADALEVVSRLASDSASIVVGGLDCDVIRAPRWHRLLAREVARVVGPSGLVFCTESTVGGLLVEHGLAPVGGLELMVRVAEEDARLGGFLGTAVFQGAR